MVSGDQLLSYRNLDLYGWGSLDNIVFLRTTHWCHYIYRIRIYCSLLPRLFVEWPGHEATFIEIGCLLLGSFVEVPTHKLESCSNVIPLYDQQDSKTHRVAPEPYNYSSTQVNICSVCKTL